MVEADFERSQDVMTRLVHDADVVVWQRPMGKNDLATITLPGEQLKVVEVDDDMTSLQDWSPLLKILQAEGYEPLNRHKGALRAADLVTVTTPELAERLGKFNRHIAVLPNHVELDVWRQARQDGQQHRTGKVRVGWAGWAHGRDLDVLRGLIEPIADRPDVEFIIAGWPEAKDFFSCEVEIIPWLPLKEYRQYVASFDIGLAPLEESTFNACKSWIKALEYMAAGVVPIVSAWHPDYTRLVEDGVTGFHARRAKNWRRCILQLVEDEDLRAEMSAAAQAAAARYDNRTQAGRKWEEAYRNAG